MEGIIDKGGPGRPTVFSVGGREYRLPPLDYDGGRDLKAAEDYYLACQKDSLQAVDDALDRVAKYPRLKDELMGRLFADLKKTERIQRPTRQQVGEFLDSSEGAAFTLQLQLSKAYPEEFTDPRGMTAERLRSLDLSRARELLAKLNLAEYFRLRSESTPRADEIVAAATPEERAAAAAALAATAGA